MSLVTITVKQDSAAGAPIADVEILINSAAGAFIELGRTGPDGSKIFSIPDGDYRVYLAKLGSGIDFTRPETLVVSGDGSVEFYGVPFFPTAPPNPALTRVYDYLYNLGLEVRPNVVVEVSISNPQAVYLVTGPILSGKLKTKTDEDGYFHFDLPDGNALQPADVVQYTLNIPSVNFSITFDADDLNSGGAIILSALA